MAVEPDARAAPAAGADPVPRELRQPGPLAAGQPAGVVLPRILPPHGQLRRGDPGQQLPSPLGRGDRPGGDRQDERGNQGRVHRYLLEVSTVTCTQQSVPKYFSSRGFCNFNKLMIEPKMIFQHGCRDEQHSAETVQAAGRACAVAHTMDSHSRNLQSAQAPQPFARIGLEVWNAGDSEQRSGVQLFTDSSRVGPCRPENTPVLPKSLVPSALVPIREERFSSFRIRAVSRLGIAKARARHRLECRLFKSREDAGRRSVGWLPAVGRWNLPLRIPPPNRCELTDRTLKRRGREIKRYFPSSIIRNGAVPV